MCRAEAPHLSRIHQKYKGKGVTVLAVLSDNETRKNVDRFVAKQKLTHPILLNGSGVAMQTYSARAYPTTYWIDKNGILVDREYGYHSLGRLDAKVQHLLKQPRRRTSP